MQTVIIIFIGSSYYYRLASPESDEATFTQNGFSMHRNDAYGSYPIIDEGIIITSPVAIYFFAVMR